MKVRDCKGVEVWLSGSVEAPGCDCTGRWGAGVWVWVVGVRVCVRTLWLGARGRKVQPDVVGM